MASWSIGERGCGDVIPVDAMTISGAVGPARCGPTLEPAGFQEREPLDLLAGVINLAHRTLLSPQEATVHQIGSGLGPGTLATPALVERMVTLFGAKVTKELVTSWGPNVEFSEAGKSTFFLFFF
ncbi:hypothetical protein ANTQUA_LOCUS4666 [Anthophora quadrimaculata]